MPLDVFEEDAARAGFGDDPAHMWPEMTRVGLALPAPGRAEGLAGISRQDDIHRSAPRAAVEAGEIIPDRRVA